MGKNNKYKNYYYHKNYYYQGRNKKRNTSESQENILLKEQQNIEVVPIKKVIENNYSLNENVNSKSKMPIIKMALGIVVLVVIVFGVSYSYFNYYQEDSRQADITTGEMYVRVPENTANITLNKLYPMTAADARARNDNYVDFTVNAKNTSNTKTLHYILSVSDGTPVDNKVRISRDYIKVDLQEKINNEYTYIKEGVSLSSFNFDDYVPASTTLGLTRQFRLRIWVSDSVLISDTEEGATFTQSEFANLYANYHVEVSSSDESVICKRATVLHTEQCENGSSSENYYCYADGYYAEGEKGTDTITYGKLGTNGEPPAVGDAFDCDVNGDGLYNSENERFYYVSNYFDTDTETFDTIRATLIYYRNFSGGAASDDAVAYYAGVNENYHGPTTAIAALPNNKTNSGTWRNDLLKTQDRKVLSCNNASCTTLYDKTNVGHSPEYPIENPTSPNPPLYNGKAARLLTLKELVAGCGSMSTTQGEISDAGCNFLFERTQYANSSYGTIGPWLENPHSSNSVWAFFARASNRYVYIYSTSDTSLGARPAIDVLYSRMAY